MAKAIIHLYIKLGSVKYLIGTLSFNEKNEIFYIFGYPDKMPNAQYDNYEEKESQKLHHLSHHLKAAHLKMVNDKYLGEQIQLLYPTEPTVKTLFAESFFSDGTVDHLIKDAQTFKEWKDSKNQLLFSNDKHLNFTVVALLVPKNYPITTLLALEMTSLKGPNIGLFYLNEKKQSIGRIQLDNDWDLIIITTTHLIEVKGLEYTNLVGPLRLINHDAPDESLYSLLEQAKQSPKLAKEDLEHWISYSKELNDQMIQK